MKRLVKYILVGSIFFVFASCSYETISNETPMTNIIQLHTKYRINLPEEHSSGYLWQLTDDYNKSIIDHSNTIWHGNTKGVDFNFKTLAPGTTTLTFILRKYNDTSGIKHFAVDIRE